MTALLVVACVGLFGVLLLSLLAYTIQEAATRNALCNLETERANHNLTRQTCDDLRHQLALKNTAPIYGGNHTSRYQEVS